MRRTRYRAGRASGCLLIIGVVLGVAGTIAYQQPDRAYAWWQRLCGMVAGPPMVESRPQPSALDRARLVQRRLRNHLPHLEIERRELDGRIRLLEVQSPLDIERGQSEDEQQNRRSQRDAYARQLVEVHRQIEAGIAMLRRVDRLVQEQEIGAAIKQADGDLLLEAAELLWTEDPGRTGPNALLHDTVIHDTDWLKPSASLPRYDRPPTGCCLP